MMAVKPWVCVTAFVAAVASTTAPSRSGLDLSSFDRSVRPQDDLYRFANGTWLDATDVPAERVSVSAFSDLADNAERDVNDLIVELAARGPYKNGSPNQQIVDLYESIADDSRIEALGAAPLKPELEKIRAIATTRALAAETGVLSAAGLGGPFEATIADYTRDAASLTVRIQQGGTLLGDRDLYLTDTPDARADRAAYASYLERIFTLVEWPSPVESARDVLTLDTAISEAQWRRADATDRRRADTRVAFNDLAKAAPGFDWRAWAQPQGIQFARDVVLSPQPFFKGFAALVDRTPLETWKAWLAARYITASAPYVSRAFADARFDLFGRLLSGQEAPRARWKRGVGLVNSYLGDAVGRLYVERHWSPAAAKRATTLVDNLVKAYRDAIAHLDWLSPGTRATALDRLMSMTIRIGAPSHWRDYRGLVVVRDDLVGNLARARAFDNASTMARLSGAGDPDEWLITPQTVNAYYNPAKNEIVLPAAMLQPPLFDSGADDAVNYGRLGAVIGHEIGHAFDEEGRFVMEDGRPRDSWTPDDARRFEARASMLANQFEGRQPVPGASVSGVFTINEDLGDLEGLSIAWQAYHRALGGTPAPEIDGFSGDQRFFLGWAQVWRTKMRDAYQRQLLTTDPHAPPQFRANVPASNLQAFVDAFGVKPGDRLYLAPDARVRIW